MLGPKFKYYRNSDRYPAWVDVTITGKDMAPIKGTVENVSLGGLYIETDSPIPGGKHTITLAFDGYEKGHVREHHLTATVAHLESGGAGLVFDNYDPETLHALRAVMSNAIQHH